MQDNFKSLDTFNTLTKLFAEHAHFAAVMSMINTPFLFASRSREEFVKTLREYAVDAEQVRCPEAMDIADLIREMASFAETGTTLPAPASTSLSQKSLTIEQLLQSFITSKEWVYLDFEIEALLSSAFNIPHREVRRMVNRLRQG
jgi:hypothetical protein